mgnify:CR=1 FL=1
MTRKFKNFKEGQMLLINGVQVCVTEECDVLQYFYASDSDGNEEPYHSDMVDAVLPN